jgi:hypothetical protein
MHRHQNGAQRTRHLAGGWVVTLTVAALPVLAACQQSDLSAATPLPSPSRGEQQISRSNLVHLWPLTVDDGTLLCRGQKDALFRATDGTEYAVNEQAKRDGYPSIRALQSPGSHIGALRSLAVGLCGR